MNYIDAKNKLTRARLRQFMKTNEDIMLTYTDIFGNEILDSYSKEDIFENLFCEKVVETINDETVVMLATSDTAMEILKVDIEWWTKPIHFNKLSTLFDGVKAKVKKQIETVSEKIIAVAKFDEEQLKDIEIMTANVKKQKETLNWLNDKIEHYVVHKMYDKLRVCIEYDDNSNENEWFTIDELLEQGIAKL